MNHIKRGHILGGQPIHEVIHAIQHGVVIEHFVQNFLGFRAYLLFGFFIDAAVDGVEHGFGQVGAGAEKLHLFANHHRAHAAGNSIIIAVEIRAHQIVVFILDR